MEAVRLAGMMLKEWGHRRCVQQSLRQGAVLTTPPG